MGYVHYSETAATRRKMDIFTTMNELTPVLRVNPGISRLKQKACMVYPQCVCIVQFSSCEPGLLSVRKTLSRLKQLLEEREKAHIPASHKTLQ